MSNRCRPEGQSYARSRGHAFGYLTLDDFSPAGGQEGSQFRFEKESAEWDRRRRKERSSGITIFVSY
jgi:hypothetical protein